MCAGELRAGALGGWLVVCALSSCVSAPESDDPGSAAETAESTESGTSGVTPTTESRPLHGESESEHVEPPDELPETPPLPEGMTLDEVLDRAASPPPDDYPEPVPDDELFAFLLVDQLELRIGDASRDQLGWESEAWAGYDYDRLWWKSEGEASFDGADEGETENDLLYSRLITPFWYAQAGAQYVSAWESGRYSDLGAAAIAFQGMAPGTFELDTSVYLSEEADLTASFEAEYDLRITQRTVLQPRVELGFAAQDVPDRRLGAGLTDGHFDLRLRYELRRDFAPYVGIRYRVLPGETGNLAESAGADDDALWLVVGARIAL